MLQQKRFPFGRDVALGLGDGFESVQDGHVALDGVVDRGLDLAGAQALKLSVRGSTPNTCRNSAAWRPAL